MIIYCIEDINDLKYVGSTKMTLRKRFQAHKDNNNCSSNKLNLYNAIIYPLEECEKEVSKEREAYWINKIDCVNIRKANFDRDAWFKSQHRQNYIKSRKEQKRLYDIEYRKKKKLKKQQSKLKSKE